MTGVAVAAFPHLLRTFRLEPWPTHAMCFLLFTSRSMGFVVFGKSSLGRGTARNGPQDILMKLLLVLFLRRVEQPGTTMPLPPYAMEGRSSTKVSLG
jgi:hypothetical protein